MEAVNSVIHRLRATIPSRWPIVLFSKFRGEIMGKYGNFKHIPGGGQANIFLGFDFDANRTRIFKVAKHDNTGSRRRLKREGRLLHEQRDNPYVVQLIEDCSHCTPPYLVLEHCS